MIVLKIGGSAFSDKRTGKSFVNIVARNVAKELPVSEEAIIVLRRSGELRKAIEGKSVGTTIF